MNLKHAIAAAVMAVAASSSFAADSVSYSGLLTGADQTMGTILASGGFSSSFTFYNASSADAWLTNGTTTYHYLDSGSGTLTLPVVGSIDWNSVALGGTLPNDNWQIHIQGTAGASYTGGATFNAGSVVPTAPVPEPETYAMMLAGLGALGFVGRRRKAK